MSLPLDPSSDPSMQDYACSNICTWCDGCGDYGIWAALKRALVELRLHPWQVLLCYDVGCHGNMSDKLQGYRFHGLHGRVLPFAAGAKIGNPRLPVIAFGGDGASFSEGVNHLVHAVRSNYPIAFVLHNNGNYGLTTGQASALTPRGQPMNASPNGIPERTLPSMDFIFSLEPTFVARGWSGDIPMLTRLFVAAVRHRGFAYVDVLQACPTYNHLATQQYLFEHCYDANAAGHNPSDFAEARAIAIDTRDRIACGILYQNTAVPSFIEELSPRRSCTATPVEETRPQNIRHLMKPFI